MKYSICTALLSLTLLNIAISTSAAQSGPDTEKIDRYFTALEENHRFMGSVAVMKDGNVLFEEAYGRMSADGTPANPETVYRIGSITKSYTSVMILKLAEENRLTLSTTLDSYFPEMPNAEKITLEQMLKHQSGLTNFTNLPDYMNYFTEERSRDDMLNIFREAGTSFEPGENTEYSNTAFVLLGYIIEEETGMTYDEALQEMISEPLQLSSTYVSTGISADKNEADSFIYQQEEWQPASRTNMMIPLGAGAIVSTTEEVARFYDALFNGELLNEESLQEITRFEGSFGLGLIRFPFHDKTLVGHNGGIDGFQSNAASSPDDGLTFAVLGNGVNYAFNDILIGLLSITFGREFEIPTFEERPAISLDPNSLGNYTGIYSAPNFPLDIELFADGDNLMGRATGQGAFPLTIYDEQTMGFEQAGIEIEFSEPVDGRYRSFQFRQAGQQFDFTLTETQE